MTCASVVAAAAMMFAGTNIDDAVVLAVFNAAARRTGAPSQRQIWAGQFLGMALMVLVSAGVALGLRPVSTRWIGLLGLLPMLLGVRLLVKAVRERGAERAALPVAAGVWSVAATTFAGGGDNIAVYTPAFRLMGPGALALTVAVFAAGTALWCVAGYLLIYRPRLVTWLRRGGTWLVPTLFIALGMRILYAAA
jgi:cadmium resistance protein CadD (predicted permease)